MLQVNYIIQNKEEVLKRLAVKNFNDTATVDEIIKTDEERRQTQAQLDQLLAKANAASKEIGQLMGQGKKEEAEQKKKETSQYKEQTANRSPQEY